MESIRCKGFFIYFSVYSFQAREELSGIPLSFLVSLSFAIFFSVITNERDNTDFRERRPVSQNRQKLGL